MRGLVCLVIRKILGSPPSPTWLNQNPGTTPRESAPVFVKTTQSVKTMRVLSA